MARTIDNSQDIMDSRDVIARLKELEGERSDLINDCQDAADEVARGVEGSQELLEVTNEALAEWDDDNGEEMLALAELNKEGESCSGWEDGATLIREDYFAEYCEELCQDIGDLPKNIPSYIVIDWEATARNIRQDYSEIDFGGVAYLVRD